MSFKREFDRACINIILDKTDNFQLCSNVSIRITVSSKLLLLTAMSELKKVKRVGPNSFGYKPNPCLTVHFKYDEFEDTTFRVESIGLHTLRSEATAAIGDNYLKKVMAKLLLVTYGRNK